MAKATTADIADEGFTAINFGALTGTWAAYVQKQLDAASAWATQRLTVVNYAAAVSPAYSFFCLVRAEIAYTAQVLWTRRMAFLDSNASLSNQDDRRGSMMRQAAANAETACEQADYWIAEAQRQFGMDPTIEGVGVSTGYTETGRFPQTSTGALNPNVSP